MNATATHLTVNLPESLLLLAADDETGKISSQMRAAEFGTAGAILLELLISGRIDVVDGNVHLLDDSATDEPVLDNALFLIGDERKPRDAKHWVRKIADAKVKEQVLDDLIDTGILRRESRKVLWVFPDDRFLAENPVPEADLRARLRASVLNDQPPDARTAALIALLKATDLLGMVFSKDERKSAKDRIDAIARGDLMSDAVAKVIKDMQAALMAAIMAATIASSVAATSSN